MNTQKKATVTVAPTLKAVHAILPELTTEEFDGLFKDIELKGQLVPILMNGKEVVDGRARLKVCKALGIKPIVHDLGSAANDADWAVSTNLFRRHLTTGQRAIFAAEMANLQKGSNQHTANKGCSRKEAALRFSVSEDSIDRARKVKELGSAKLVSMVRNGKVSLDAAVGCVNGYPDTTEQDQILVNGVAVLKKAKYKEQVLDQKRASAQKLAVNNEAALETLRGTYSIIYADPPWNYGGNNEGSYCDPSVHYPLMSTESIMALPVKECLGEDAALYLWVPSCLVPDGIKVLEAWGFKFVNTMVWCKNRAVMSLGSTKTAHEILLIGKKGGSLHINKHRLNSWIQADVTEHSKKPEVFATMLDKMYAGLPKLEMFAREPRGEEWSVFGNQVLKKTGKTNASKAPLVNQPKPGTKTTKPATQVKLNKAKVLGEIFGANDPRSNVKFAA